MFENEIINNINNYSNLKEENSVRVKDDVFSTIEFVNLCYFKVKHYVLSMIYNDMKVNF